MSVIKNAWNLGKGFFIDKETRRRAWGLAILTLILEFTLVYFAVLLNQWSASFYDALQNLDKTLILKSIFTFGKIVIVYMIVFASKYVSQSKLQINWRLWMTEKSLDKWTKDSSFFGINLLNKKNDNPDQRISEDINGFIQLSIKLSFTLLSNLVSLVTFLVILWGLSGILKLTIFNHNINIHGYLIWVAILYTGIGTFITHRIGKQLSNLDYLQEQKEANFRFSMMRFRENSETIALYNGASYEKMIFSRAFNKILENFNSIIIVNRNLGLWLNIYNNLASILPILVALPRFFAKEIALGGLMQIRSAFSEVKEAFSFLINSFSDIASYKAIITRLSEFNDNIEIWSNTTRDNNIKILHQNTNDLTLKDLTILSPAKETLLDNLNLTFSLGNKYLITGSNGCGKSTLLKAIAGIWVFGKGEIIKPANKKLFFIPQKIYMNSGTLLQVITYPETDFKDVGTIKTLMQAMNIEYLIDRLEREENWSISLSGGEQQKLSILRAIIHNPDILIMDEATSALTEKDQKIAYELLSDKLKDSILISVGHRASLKDFHNQQIDLDKYRV